MGLGDLPECEDSEVHRSVLPGRTQSTREEADVCPSRPARTTPEEAIVIAAFGLGRTMLFEGEACAKGTALVAEAREDAMRDPRSQRATRGGSSGGRNSIVHLPHPNETARAYCASRTERNVERCCASSDRTVREDRNPMRGGSTCWAEAGRDASRWMSTGRPRVMR